MMVTRNNIQGIQQERNGQHVGALIYYALVGVRSHLWRFVLLGLVLGSFCMLSSPVHAASVGRIYGQLLDGSENNVPLAGQSVTLQMAKGNTATDVVSMKTDGQGTYTFANLPTDKSISYVVYMRYQGAQYISDIVNLASKPVQQLNLTVYKATSSTANM